jgi:hypothetical protein
MKHVRDKHSHSLSLMTLPDSKFLVTRLLHNHQHLLIRSHGTRKYGARHVCLQVTNRCFKIDEWQSHGLLLVFIHVRLFYNLISCVVFARSREMSSGRARNIQSRQRAPTPFYPLEVTRPRPMATRHQVSLSLCEIIEISSDDEDESRTSVNGQPWPTVSCSIFALCAVYFRVITYR